MGTIRCRRRSTRPQLAEQVRPGGAPLKHHPVIFDIAIWIAGAVAAFLAVLLGQRVRPRLPQFVATTLFLACLVAQLAVYYHVAALLGLAGSVVAFRYRGSAPIERRYGRFVLGSAAIALVHVGLITAWPGSMIKLVGAIVGQPSVWPYVRVMDFSVVAGALARARYGVGPVGSRVSQARARLLAAGAARRVDSGVLPRVLHVGHPVALHSRIADPDVVVRIRVRAALHRSLVGHGCVYGAASRPIQHAAVLAVVVIAANPAATVASMTSDGSQYPDHRGAARFMRTQHITPDDIVLAEDVLQQTYYLGRVDYWLIGRKHAWRYLQQVDGRIQDFYTATAVIDTGEQFRELLDANPQRRIFVIGSGENIARRSSRDARQGDQRAAEVRPLRAAVRR